jgi:hypothetical protein
MLNVGQHTLQGIVVGYVAPRATHFTDYCCWFTRGLGRHTLLGIVVGYARFWATHFTGHHKSDIWGAFIDGFKIIPFLNNSRKVEVSVPYLLRNCWSEYPLTNQITWHCFPVSQLTSTNVPQSDKSHIHKLAPSPKPSGGRVYASYQYWCSNIYQFSANFIWLLQVRSTHIKQTISQDSGSFHSGHKLIYIN